MCRLTTWHPLCISLTLQPYSKEERQRILEDIPDTKADGEVKTEDDKATTTSNDEADTAIKSTKKRPHGKIGFESLAKKIGERWKNLEQDKIEYYKEKAAEDTQRYKREMEVYLGQTKKVDGDEDKPKTDDV